MKTKNKKQNKKVGVKKDEVLFKNVDQATEISTYYGFYPIENPEIKKIDKDLSQKIIKEEIKALAEQFPIPESFV
jgi:ferritin-like protein